MKRNEVHEDEVIRKQRSAERTKLIENLRGSEMVPGIAVGEHAPDFTLSNPEGKEVSLAATLESGPVVLVFYRGSWCPICNTHIRSLQNILSEIEALGAHLIAVSPQRPEFGKEFTSDLELGFDVLSDIDQSVIRVYHLQFHLPDQLAEHSADLGHPIDEMNADGSHNLPVPGTFIIDRSGIVRARHVDPNWRERMEPGDVLEALRSIALDSPSQSS